MLYEPKGGTEFVVKRVRIVANNIQPTALGRTFRAERCNDDVPARFDRMGDLSHVRYPIVRISEEVEDGAIMPQVELMTGESKCSYVPAEPVDPDRVRAKPCLGDFQCGRGKIQCVKISVAAPKKIIRPVLILRRPRQ